MSYCFVIRNIFAISWITWRSYYLRIETIIFYFVIKNRTFVSNSSNSKFIHQIIDFIAFNSFLVFIQNIFDRNINWTFKKVFRFQQNSIEFSRCLIQNSNLRVFKIDQYSWYTGELIQMFLLFFCLVVGIRAKEGFAFGRQTKGKKDVYWWLLGTSVSHNRLCRI